MMYALHAGMPARSVRDLLEVINQHSSQDGSPAAEP